MILGLSQQEVEARMRKGEVNKVPRTQVHASTIIARNVFTLFNVINCVIAGFILFTQSYANLLFLLVVVANTAIATFQELRAHKQLSKLRILYGQTYSVIRNGCDQKVPQDELLLGDCVRLLRGSLVPCDMEILEGSVQVNESMLTGESQPVQKTLGEELLGGTNVSAGACIARCTRVGAQMYAAKLEEQITTGSLHESFMKRQVKWIISAVSLLVIPLGCALFISSMMQHESLNTAILGSAGAMIGMIPQGLVLLISAALAASAFQLASKHVLLQNMYSQELLLESNVLVLDKTGTLTTNELDVQAFCDSAGHKIDVQDAQDYELLQALLCITYANKDDANETAKAIVHALPASAYATSNALVPIAFSSEQKFSGAKVQSSQVEYLLGAPGFLGLRVAEEEAYLQKLNTAQRVLLVAKVKDNTASILGSVILQEHMRKDVAQSLAALQKAGLEIKVVSGDGTKAVWAAAKEAQIKGATQPPVDISSLKTSGELAKIAQSHALFSRATPAQKAQLVEVWQEQGKRVAMMGDGVNDVLALNKAHCAITLKDATQAAVNVADLVLLDNSFAGLTKVLWAGERMQFNLTSSAGLFLTKTLLSILLAVVCVIAPPYFFVPIQLSLVSALVIGAPSVLLGFWPTKHPEKTQFLPDALRRALPAVLTLFLSFVFLWLVSACGLFGTSPASLSTLALITWLCVGAAEVAAISKIFGKKRYVISLGLLVIGIAACVFFPAFFEVSVLNCSEIVFLCIFEVCATVVFATLFMWFSTHPRVLAPRASSQKRQIHTKD